MIEHYGSVNYRRNDKLLEQWGTFCWYVNRPGGSVRFGAGLQFKNGQYVTVTGKGIIRISRPQVEFTDQPPSAVAVVGWKDQSTVALPGTPVAFQMLELGPPETGDMRWTMKIQRPGTPHGLAAYTQLITRTSTGPDTGGQKKLDKSVFYRDALIEVHPYDPQTPTKTHVKIPFTDNPGTQCRSSTSHENIADSFNTYLRFMPTRGLPGENIFVTLRRVDWQWSEEATNVAGVWTVTTSSVPARPLIPTDTDEFPEWTNIFHPTE